MNWKTINRLGNRRWPCWQGKSVYNGRFGIILDLPGKHFKHPSLTEGKLMDYKNYFDALPSAQAITFGQTPSFVSNHTFLHTLAESRSLMLTRCVACHIF